ncbi:hypothetical protein JAAARDRAFT_204806 [Jaapia argillacea MUCL 33604]|uniref:Uncharacterized protein n=1 Tax=Jaapia argillacea MUCL 33604 TaxID=933084 RepID=A0A067Q1U1_9AGAM|nr:hypothetical protein JAAARDRAFT_204806 [Jaapia argillacea MUCL 33604]
MDQWPTTDGTGQKRNVPSRRRVKDEEDSWSYPCLEEGVLNAATLQDKNGRLEWTLASRNKARRLTPKGQPTVIFPATRPPEIQAPHGGIQQRSEQGAHFLRTYLPDVDIPAELIREEIAADARSTEKFQDYDPSLGNVFDVIRCYDDVRDPHCFMVAPIGEYGIDLNFSPITFKPQQGIVCRPSAHPVRSFQTPIQQISASSPASGRNVEASLLGVRTSASTVILEVKTKSLRSRAADIPQVTVVDLLTVSRSAVDDRPVVDVGVRSSPEVLAMFVNAEGAVYKCNFSGGQALEMVHPKRETSSDDLFWRIAVGKDCASCLVTSHKAMTHLDFRKGSSSLVYSIENKPGELITAIESAIEDELVRVTTTSEILWLDERFRKRPLLAYKHGRQFDRTLQTRTISVSRTPLTFLTSRKNGLVTIYDVCADDGSARVHSNCRPYVLPPITLPDVANSGYTIFRHPLDRSQKNATLMQYSSGGGVYKMDLELVSDPPLQAGQPDFGEMGLEEPEWSPELLRLKAMEDQANVGPLGAQEFSEVDLRPVYERLFFPESQEEEVSGRDVDDLLETMSDFWQALDAPIDHPVTMFDVTYRTGDEPTQSSRSDFFTQTPLNSHEGFRALVTGRIPQKELSRRAAWHHDITSILQRFTPQLSRTPQETFQNLEVYKLAADGRRPPASLRRETDAQEQLTVDLSLSTDVFSSRPFVTPSPPSDDDVETMSRAAEAMSLVDGEPPPIQFGYLRPVHKAKAGHYARENEIGITDAGMPQGVRLLLKEWDIGDNPQEYSYEDPYDVIAAAPGLARDRTQAPSSLLPRGEKEPPAGTQRPPTIFATKSRAPPPIAASQSAMARLPVTVAQTQEAPVSRPLPNFGSQPTITKPGTNMSQDMIIPSTQVLPGPFGGRPQPGKKKPAKKRVGGF